MRVGPAPAARTFKPWALLSPLGTTGMLVTTTDDRIEATSALQVHRALRGVRGHAVYVTANLSRCRLFGGDARAWRVTLYNGRPVKMRHDGAEVSVRSLRGVLPAGLDPGRALDTFTAWLRALGVPLGSLSAMARRLWRAYLPGPVDLHADPVLAREALFGGRQGMHLPKAYRGQAMLDLVQAYPWHMAARPYAGQLRQVSSSTRIDPAVAGLARVRVRIPERRVYGLLPERPPQVDGLVAWRRGRVIEGTWAWCELAAALACGAELVEVHEVFAPRIEADLFGSWGEAVATGRELPDGADRLAKSVANCTWGTFCMRGVSCEATWLDAAGRDRKLHRPKRQRGRDMAPYMTHVAVETTARVRARMLADVIGNPGVPDPCHLDTDGAWVDEAADYASLLGQGPGAWRIKQRATVVEVRAPQIYRYLCTDPMCGREGDRLRAAIAGGRQEVWHYVAAGVPAELAPGVFRQGTPRWRAQLTVDLPAEWGDSLRDIYQHDPWGVI